MRFTSDNYPKQLQITLEYTFQYHPSLDTSQHENEWLTTGPYRQKYVHKVTMANISSGLNPDHSVQKNYCRALWGNIYIHKHKAHKQKQLS